MQTKNIDSRDKVHDFCTMSSLFSLTWNFLSQDVLIQGNENICITVSQFPQPQVYVTLAE